ncbi:MAG: helix-turn-helix domain-containing protein [Fibrobacteres bacterium]|nr:helix-turn-helix domain-containing protein [Fibrobacterota bacterium]
MLQININSRLYTIDVIHASNSVVSRKNLRAGAHWHPVYHILYYFKGVGRLYLRDSILTIAPGSAVFISPNEKHEFIGCRDHDHEYAEVTFSLLDQNRVPSIEPFSELFKCFGYQLDCANPVKFKRKEGDSLHCALKGIEYIGFTPPTEQNRVNSITIQLLNIIEIAAKAAGKPFQIVKQTGTVRSSTVSAIIEYVNTHFQSEIRLEALAEKYGWSREHLSRKFHAETGELLRDYIQNLRLTVAEKMLTTDSMPIKEIAAKVGIEDVFYFTKLFKKKYGSPPAKYLNNLRN